MTDNVFALPTGTELNHYVIESVLGQGGFGVVYKAQHALLRQMVVIKESLPFACSSKMSASYNKAVEWHKKAARAGNPSAKDALSGRGILSRVRLREQEYIMKNGTLRYNN
ncbi:hypothetical protein Q4567_14225 [Aliiglaciecola sp. 2_MG-2023]|uniref:hypothetical protein n=1 Tax=unclassified Aliiglaciecola TaxID=2593648 RepID=UPI0026E1625A|nr:MULTISPECIES: hypothetical protein [unclassified Aliiglaciecola]MDO6711886.1 hypothetical protein [Aliiglaciecola sp. 2_MG-2023]MDO6753140.1 hypothetical protein [Aliiglaciecola sp. 1_MG-2023]